MILYTKGDTICVFAIHYHVYYLLEEGIPHFNMDQVKSHFKTNPTSLITFNYCRIHDEMFKIIGTRYIENVNDLLSKVVHRKEKKCLGLIKTWFVFLT